MKSIVFPFWSVLGASLFNQRGAFRMAWFFYGKKMEKGVTGCCPMLILDHLKGKNLKMRSIPFGPVGLILRGMLFYVVPILF